MKYDVAIIGGGIIGWSCAYHILRQNPKIRCLVVEKQPSSASGATGKSAGGVRAQFGTPINIALSMASIKEYETLERGLNRDVGFRQVGYLFVTSTEQGEQYLETVIPIQKQFGVPVEKLSKIEIESIAPFINCADIRAGSFSKKDGVIDPYSVCIAYEGGAIEFGAERLLNHEVVDGDANNLTLKHQNTSLEIEAHKIVLAAGQWSQQVGKIFGLDIPIKAEKHQLALTEPTKLLPPQIPMIVDLDTTFHFRREGDRLLIGYNDPCANKNDSSEHFDESFLEHMAQHAMHRLPTLERIGFDTKKSWGGHYAETPDHHAIIGEQNGIIVATGFGGHGVMHAPAAGIAVAELIIQNKSTTFDIRPLRPQRFAENDLTHEPMII